MKKLFIVIIVMFITNISFADVRPKATNKNVDVSNFDISGIKLGMTPNEVVKQIMSKYNVTRDEIFIFYVNSKKSTDEKNIRGILFKKDGEIISVNFTRKVSAEHPVKVAKYVKYTFPRTKENEKQVTQMAIQKYNQPSKIMDGNKYFWCYLDRNDCDKEKGQLSLKEAYANSSYVFFLELKTQQYDEVKDKKPALSL